ncbi:MAG: ACT domain-containing protein [Gammaproteobacteria bacterium]|jgi:hypothetical protein|nr:ACT domain-containing protein [Gammaproteobacteria bacterium]
MKTLNIIHEDHPGLLAEVTTLLEQGGVAVQDFAGLSVGDTAVLSLTVENFEQVFRMLSDAGYRVIASEHLLVRLEKHPGALAELSRRLAEENVNVRGMHIVTKDEKTGIVALETIDHEKAREILKDILVG